MFEEEIEDLKELIHELEEEVQEGNNEEAVASVWMICGICSFLRSNLSG